MILDRDRQERQTNKGDRHETQTETDKTERQTESDREADVDPLIHEEKERYEMGERETYRSTKTEIQIERRTREMY